MFMYRLGLWALLGVLGWPPAPAHSPQTTSRPASGTPEVVLAGRITDRISGNPIQGAQVVVEGEQIGGLTDRSGIYSFDLPQGWAGRRITVRADHIGYAGARQVILLSEGSNTLDMTLEPQRLKLDAVMLSPSLAREEARVRGIAAPATVAFQSTSLAGRYDPDFNTESYAHIQENAFLSSRANPLSTFSIDVDRASYANVRRFISSGHRPPVDAVRIEELINYFPYSDPAPEGPEPLAVHAEVAPAPWQPLHRIVRVALKGRAVDMTEAPASNLVFLLDVSGSMNSPDKLPLLKTAFGMLVDQMRPQDRVAIVVYAGAAGLVLPSTAGSEKEEILEAIQALEAGGSTAGGAGIQLAYKVAAEHHIEGGNNRVILATDGDFNVGASSDSEMIRLIEEKRDQGTFLTVLGFGTGNLKDSKMEQIADHGNGNFSYIDSALEAKKVLVSEMGGTLLTIAKDVKIQVEFNPARVVAYRLIGYENRLLAAEDFNDDTKDAGELGAGHSVTALYEVIPAGVESPVEIRVPDSLRYGSASATPPISDSEELLFVKLRYKEPDESESRLLTLPVGDQTGPGSTELRFASAVAAWGMLLRDSEYCAGFSLEEVAELARESLGIDPEGYRSEFVRLVETARSLELLEKEPGSAR